MIEFTKWLPSIFAVGAVIGSWRLIEYKQAQQNRTNSRVEKDIGAIVERVNDLEKREGIATAKREEMMRMLEENSADVKAILQEIVKLATLVSMQQEKRQ